MRHTAPLNAHLMGIDTHEEPIVFMRSDCAICRAEGFSANTRLQVQAGERSLIANLNIVSPEVLEEDHIGFSDSAWAFLDLSEGQRVHVRHAPLVRSLSALRKKIYGHELNALEINTIIRDIGRRLYSDIEIASFLTASAAGHLTAAEVTAMTRAMVNSGNQLHWTGADRVFDKHCIGGLPGNRTTPIVISIASAAGLMIPKTSSRAITSPAGTADTMEVLTEVDLSLEQLQRVVEQTGACLAAGGKVDLSPVDDLLIRIERALDLDSPGQLVASVLSKKVAAGSNHILIDMPVGPTAKLRSREEADELAALFRQVANAMGLHLHCVITDGTQAIGYGVGPMEEARDVLAVLRNSVEAPSDLAERSLFLAANLLAMDSGEPLDVTIPRAREILYSGQAWQQFQRICHAQGGLKPLAEAPHHSCLRAQRTGKLGAMDNRRLAQLAKLAGAPSSPLAGLRLHVKVGDSVIPGQPLATLFADTPGELAYARDYYHQNRDLFDIESAS
ncbi:thymidine phosphorylase [Microbulbifer flavimaris]|uniref:Putative thymidine phosphorylase n=1 Tax=Microbulbifer flavimaris TaxID=1781068 RepID=A0ABX4HX74_9GAMM|nr:MULTISPECIES: thymidine phosphorylase family protein [Microbulbifer]KUJ81611.1 thymidine phosphorylase [Microbulbifer sp. ZGT114]PCO04521.1 thymidine phosphorylase [Microbulbifer flavimaris]